MKFDVVVIGGGPAGMAAALAAHKNGGSVLIVERDCRLGGILNQCIHLGFGLHYFGEEMTGPEYANRFVNMVMATNIVVLLNTMVIKISNANSSSPTTAQAEMSSLSKPETSTVFPDTKTETDFLNTKTETDFLNTKTETVGLDKKIEMVVPDTKTEIIGLDKRIITVLSPELGMVEIEASAVVLAMGCRERTAGAIALAGTRPAGVYTAGMAQKLCNQKGYLVGKKVVILGSGDIGLIMARRMTFEGAKVDMVLELMPFSSGLKRNIVQCLDDFDIPIKYSHTITKIVGSPRLSGLFYAPVDSNRNPKLNEEKFVECDTLLLSVGLIPENDLLNGLGIEMSMITSGAVVDENRMTSEIGIFSCGNVLHVHDLVDNVSVEAEVAGLNASIFAQLLQNTHLTSQNKQVNCHSEHLRRQCIFINSQVQLANDQMSNNQKMFDVVGRDGVRYALPQKIHGGSGDTKVFFRVSDVFKNCTLVVECLGEKIYSKKYMILSPGEMENVNIAKEKIEGELVLRLVR